MAHLVDHARIVTLAGLLFLGLGAGSVAEQRARLPPPATCDDPVVGVWKSHTWTASVGRWDEFHLRIGRVEGDEHGLVGTIHNHAWAGPKDEPQPPVECQGDRTKFATDGVGSIRGLHVEFKGTGAPRIEANVCGRKQAGNYNLDSFAGDIDPEIQEFQTLNNDGGVHVNFPVVFRRISCGDAPEKPIDPVVDPPPFQPPSATPSSGCGW